MSQSGNLEKVLAHWLSREGNRGFPCLRDIQVRQCIHKSTVDIAAPREPFVLDVII